MNGEKRIVGLRCKAGETEVSRRGNSDVHPVYTNDKQLMKINNDKTVVKKCKNEVCLVSQNGPNTREELLGYDLSADLDDRRNLPWYISLANQYPEGLLRQILSESKQVPGTKIRKNRAALFNHLLRTHLEKNNPRLP